MVLAARFTVPLRERSDPLRLAGSSPLLLIGKKEYKIAESPGAAQKSETELDLLWNSFHLKSQDPKRPMRERIQVW